MDDGGVDDPGGHDLGGGPVRGAAKSPTGRPGKWWAGGNMAPECGGTATGNTLLYHYILTETLCSATTY